MFGSRISSVSGWSFQLPGSRKICISFGHLEDEIGKTESPFFLCFFLSVVRNQKNQSPYRTEFLKFDSGEKERQRACRIITLFSSSGRPLFLQQAWQEQVMRRHLHPLSRKCIYAHQKSSYFRLLQADSGR